MQPLFIHKDSAYACISRNNFSLQFEKFIEACRWFDVATVCNSNSSLQLNRDGYSNYDVLAAYGVANSISRNENALAELQSFISEKNNWYFGHLSYDLKNEIESLTSGNDDGLLCPELFFYKPMYVFAVTGDDLKIYFNQEKTNEGGAISLLEKIMHCSLSSEITKNKFTLNSKVDRENYIHHVNELKKEIQLGNIYEINYCTEHFSDNAEIDPYQVFIHLNEISPMPMSAFHKNNHHFALCASPERFLAKRGNKIISQPIKGTAARRVDVTEDLEAKENLRSNTKEQSENVMIVDLVRNDLSKFAKRNSVKVEELFGIYTFKQLHHMISTIVCEADENISFREIIRATFPMGSMTGAPKVSAMQQAEIHENSKRGLYSGSIGYIDINNNFDFNVVIRSILYNSQNKFLSYMAGSAITIDAIAEQEYNECMLKAESMKKAIENK